MTRRVVVVVWLTLCLTAGSWATRRHAESFGTSLSTFLRTCQASEDAGHRWQLAHRRDGRWETLRPGTPRSAWHSGDEFYGYCPYPLA